MKLNEVFPNWLFHTQSGISGGFFTQFQIYLATNEIDIPWIANANTAYLLDMEYHGNISGEKPIAPLLENMLIDNQLTTNLSQHVCGMFYAMFGINLQKQYAVLSAEYNPIENYSMTESGTDRLTGTDTDRHTGTDTDAHTGTTTDAHTGTITDAGTENRTESIWAYDSAAMNPANNDSGTTGNTRTHANSDTTTHNDTIQKTRDMTDETTHNTTNAHNLTRSGNIGVTTSQQMLESEITLWQWNFYKNYLFPVVDSVLTLPIY